MGWMTAPVGDDVVVQFRNKRSDLPCLLSACVGDGECGKGVRCLLPIWGLKEGLILTLIHSECGAKMTVLVVTVAVSF